VGNKTRVPDSTQDFFGHWIKLIELFLNISDPLIHKDMRRLTGPGTGTETPLIANCTDGDFKIRMFAYHLRRIAMELRHLVGTIL